MKRRGKDPFLSLDTAQPGRDELRLYIGSLPALATRNKLFSAFRSFGRIAAISPVYKPARKPAYAFLEFELEACARNAQQASISGRGIEIAGQRLCVRRYMQFCKSTSKKQLNLHRTGVTEDAPMIADVRKAGTKETSDVVDFTLKNTDDTTAQSESSDMDIEISSANEDDYRSTESISPASPTGPHAAFMQEDGGEISKTTQRSSPQLSEANGPSSPLVSEVSSTETVQLVIDDSEDDTKGEAASNRALRKKYRLRPIGPMWRPPTLSHVPPECVLLFREDDGVPWADEIHRELLSKGVRVEECLVSSADNKTIAAALSHLACAWEPVFALVLQTHNITHRTVSLVRFEDPETQQKRGGLPSVQYDMSLEVALGEISTELATFRHTALDWQRQLRYAVYSMASGLRLHPSDDQRLCEELLAIRGRGIVKKMGHLSERAGQDNVANRYQQCAETGTSSSMLKKSEAMTSPVPCTNKARVRHP